MISAGLIAPGDVDERDIREVAPDELRGYTQCHFFAGIGVWSYALRQAGWPDDRPVWTGSCPCQPFSCAGERKGFVDERHLWPQWFSLIRECCPVAIFGEQVANALEWFDLVSNDLEGASYAVGAAIIGAHSVGAPHIRQRIYFVASRMHTASERFPLRAGKTGGEQPRSEELRLGNACDNSNANGKREWRGPGWLDPKQVQAIAATGATRGFWKNCDWWHGSDGKWRPIEPGLQPLAHGAASKMGRLRAYGNAICAPTAQAFIESFIASQHESDPIAVV